MFGFFSKRTQGKEAREVELLLQGIPVNMAHDRILAIQWDPDTNRLTITFRNGAQHHYETITKAKVLEFWAAPSKGTWMWDNLLVRGEGNRGKHQVPHQKYR